MASALPTGGEISTSLVRDHLYNFDKECFVDKLSTTSQNGCSAAYSTRLLRSNYYGPMVRVRRNSDNAEQDFYGDVFGKLGTRIYATGTSLTTWLGGATGYVRMMYDQSGNVRNIGQATNANQPTITTSAITYSGSQWLELTNTQIPTAAMTSNSSGGLVASASSVHGWEPYLAFDLNSGTGWHSDYTSRISANNPLIYSANGQYGGSVETIDINGVIHRGEWLQIQLANAIKLNSFYISPRAGVLENIRSPVDFTILASNNGTTWNVVHNEFNINNWTSASKTFTVTTPNIQSYSYYRIVVKRIGLSGLTSAGFANADSVQIMEWVLNPTTVPLVAGNDTYTYYATWTPAINGYCVICEQNGSGASRRACLLQTDQLKYGFNGQGNDAHYMVSLVTNVKRRTVMMCNHTLSTNNVEIYDEGVLYKATSSAPVNLNVGSDIFIIGRKSNGTEYMTGQINEVIVTNNTAFEREALLYFTPTLLTKPKDLFPKPKKMLTFSPLTDNPTPSTSGGVASIAVANLNLDLINVGNGNVVSDWNGYTQGTSGNRPVYYDRGGYTNDMGYVNFTRSSGQFLDGGSRTFNIATNGGFSMVCLVQFSSPANWDRIVDFGNGAGNSSIILHGSAARTLYFYMFEGTTPYSINVANAYSTNEWCVFTCRYRTSDNYAELRNNGILLTSGTFGAMSNRTLSNCYVGRSNYTGEVTLDGKISGLYMFDRYISDIEMVALGNSLTTYSTPNIPRHISELSMVNVQSMASLPTRTGWSGYFNGTAGNYIDMMDVPNAPMSFCFWFYATSSTYSTIVGLCDLYRNGNGIQIDYPTATNQLTIYSAVPSMWSGINLSNILVNTWYHLVVTTNTNFQVQVYLNGVYQNQVTGTALIPARSRFTIGAAGDGSRGYQGHIQDFRVYDYILRADEISRIYDGVSMNQTTLQSPTNYLVNCRNWYSIMQVGRNGAYVPQLTGSDPNGQYQLTNSTTNLNNYLYHTQRIQDYKSFTCSFELYTSGLGGSDGGGDQMYFFVGSPVLTTFNEAIVNGMNFIDFQVYRLNGSANRGVAFFRNGVRTSQSHYAQYVNASRWVSVSITYNRSGNEASWIINMDGQDIINYTDTNNEAWRSASGNYWGIGAWTGGAVMTAYIRRVELTYVPQASSILNRGLTMNSLKRFPEGALTANSSLNCVASASSTLANGFHSAFKAFDYSAAASGDTASSTMYHSAWSTYNSTTGAYIGGVSTTVSGISYSGEWLQIQLPRAIKLFNYVISCRPGYVSSQSPNTWVIAGSNDGTTWTLLDTETNVSTWDSLRLTFNVNNSATYTYFRIICTVTGQSASSDRQAFIVSEWELYSLPFTSVKYPIAPLRNEYPPVALTALTGTISGQLYGNGVYTCSLSASYYGAENAVQVFNKNETDLWHGGTNAGDLYNASTGVYSGNKSTTDISSTVHSGEWVQITLPEQIVLAEFAVGSSNGNGGDATRKAPRDFVILGSNDNGTTWTLIHTTTNFVGWSDATPNSHRLFRLASTPSRFFTYRMVIKRVGTSDAGSGQSLIFMSEWRLYALPIFSGNGMGSGVYKVTSSSTWENGNYTGWKAFNNTVINGEDSYHVGNSSFYSGANNTYSGGTTTTISGSSYAGEWLQIELPHPIRLTRYSLLCRFSSSNQAPKTWKIAGSNDNSTWTEVDTETGITGWADNVARTFTTTNSTVAYKYYRMVCNAAVADVNWAQGEWMLYDDTTTTSTLYGKAPGLVEGLTWKYYNEYLADDMAAFDNRTYRNIGKTTNLSNLSSATNGQYFDNWSDSYSVEWTGYFRANVTGTYTFQAYSDDTCYVWIGQNALSGYTTSNYLLYENSAHLATRTNTIYLVEGVYYPFRMRWGEGGGLDYVSLNFTPPGGTQTFDGTGYFFSSIGTNQAYPAESAKIIKELSSTNIDGVYYINVNGVSTATHCLMNDIYDGGGWMMLMKATRGTTFNYSANYWTTANTLNPGETNRNNGDAKFDTFNYMQIKDVMAIWPDISSTSYTNIYGKNGGSLLIDDGWVWKIDNWNGSTRTTALAGFQNPRNAHPSNPYVFNGFSTGIFSAQTPTFRHMIGGLPTDISSSNAYGRWAIVMNENAVGDFGSCDVSCGIGTYHLWGSDRGFSAGDFYGCCATVGINRQARLEMYGR